jgi:hypothetical protein
MRRSCADDKLTRGPSADNHGPAAMVLLLVVLLLVAVVLVVVLLVQPLVLVLVLVLLCGGRGDGASARWQAPRAARS